MRLSLFLYVLCFSLLGFSQTYEIVEVDIVCESSSIEGINSKGSDFSPFISNGEFYMTSSREFDKFNLGENNWKNSGYLNIFKAKIKGEVDANIETKPFSIVSQNLMAENHTGPLTISITGDTMFFTQVLSVKKNKRKNKFRPQLYMSVKVGGDWDDPIALPFNDPAFSYGHPSFDHVNKRLYFASDREGGMGGKDIYYSEIKQGQWADPVNVKSVNSDKDEVFPYLIEGVIFFSSNRATSKGGLDIFWKVIDQELDQPQSLAGLNSEQDDFGLFVMPGMKKGFYASNKNGNDDIFFLTMEKKVTVKNQLAGKFTYRNLDGTPSGLKVIVTGEEDELLFETTTDDKGQFQFNNIDYDGKYKITTKSEDDLYLTIYDKDGNPVVDLVTDEKGAFTYKKLSYEKSGTLSLVPEDMIDMTLNQGHLSGQFIYENIPGEYPNKLNVILEDNEGNMKFTTFTDENGNFDFRKLDMEENYILKVPEGSDELILLIFDQKGNVVAQLKGSETGQFTYRKLKPTFSNSLAVLEENEEMFELETQTISGYFEYQNIDNEFKNGLKVQAYSEDGLLLDETLTDNKGNFRFRNLPIDDNLLFKVNEKDENLELDDFTLYIFDRNGKKIAQLKRGQNDYFIYKPLGFENSTLTHVSEDSLDINISIDTDHDIVIVYFDSNKSNAKSSDLKKLSKLLAELKNDSKLRIEVNAYADAKNSDDYNLILSGKRGDWVVNYFTKKGISKSRFIVNAYGEAGLVDENNDALNRRAEIRIY